MQIITVQRFFPCTVFKLIKVGLKMNPEVIFNSDYDSNVRLMDSTIRLQASFDLIGRDIIIGPKRARMYFVNGMVDNESITNMMELMLRSKDEKIAEVKNAKEFADRYIAFSQTSISTDVHEVITFVFSGTIGMLVEGCPEAVIIDVRNYPTRSVGEPENDRVLRGPHEGFVETMVFNTALIRRRIRDTNLTVKIMKIGKRSKTDVAICYLENKVSKKMLDNLTKKFENIEINSLTMGQESLLEGLVKNQKYNPFPRVRYTERPDSAAACIAEGSILVLIDNTPAAMILPTGIFDFFQDTNDYYFMPVIGTYLRWLRMIVSFASLFAIPTWYLLMKYPDYIPQWLNFMKIEEPVSLPILAQLILIEFIIGALQIASLNTPTAMGSTFSIIAALVLGEFAVSAKWFVPEVMLYMAFVSIANFTQSSFEISFAIKQLRIFYLLLTAIFGIWGYAGAVVASIILIATTKTLTGRSYLYPLIPFNWQAFSHLMFRRHLNKMNN
jgi:stage V sporulation protein AF